MKVILNGTLILPDGVRLGKAVVFDEKIVSIADEGIVGIELPDEFGSTLYITFRNKHLRLGHAYISGRTRHQLHQSHRTHIRYCLWVKH